MTTETLTDSFLEEEFTFDGHPADLEQMLVDGYERYGTLPRHRVQRSLFRQNFNKAVDILADMRNGMRQFNYLTAQNQPT